MNGLCAICWVLQLLLTCALLLVGALVIVRRRPDRGTYLVWKWVGSIIITSALLSFCAFGTTLLIINTAPSSVWSWTIWQTYLLLLGAFEALMVLSLLTFWPVFLRPIFLDELQLRHDDGLLVAHLSDLHICATHTLEGHISREKVKEAARRALRWALDRAKLVLITGDLTDSGDKQEWKVFAELIDELGFDERRY